MATPHNSASKGEIAKTVLLPGDPLRAKYIAENFLKDVKCMNKVRNMLGYTGTFEGKEVSVMGAGMGMPSMGIYSHELYEAYDVDQIIRIGSAGALQEHMKLKDLIIAMGACTDSNYASQLNLSGTYAPIATYGLLEKAVTKAKELGINTEVGNVLSSDIFYNFDHTVNEKWAKMGILAAEMEAAALYINAAYAHKKALCMLMVSDQLCTGEALSAEDRQLGFKNMIEVALRLV